MTNGKLTECDYPHRVTIATSRNGAGVSGEMGTDLSDMRSDFGVESIQKFVERFAAERAHQYFANANRGESIQIIRELGRRRQNTFDVSSGVGPFRREANVHAMANRKALQTSPAPRGELANPYNPFRNLLRIHPRTMPSVTEFDRPPHRALADTANPDWNRAGNWTRPEAHPAEVEELAMKFRHRRRPRRTHQRDRFVGVCAPILK